MRISETQRVANLRYIGMTVVLGLVLSLLLIGTASAAECQNLTIEGGHITARSGNVADVETGLVGPYLWVRTTHLGEVDETAGTSSHEIPGDSTAVVCPDGSVEFTVTTVDTVGVQPVPLPPPPAPVEADPMTVDVVIDVAPVWNFLTNSGYAQIVAG